MSKVELNQTSIEAWDLDDLIPAPNNHKIHSDESVARLAKSMADIGQLQSVLVDKDREIIAGHGRWMAARKLGWKKIKVIQLSIDRATAIKARIADNLMSTQEYDTEKLNAEIRELDTLIDNLVVEDVVGDMAFGNITDTINDLNASLNTDATSQNPVNDAAEMAQETEAKIAEASDAQTRLQDVFGFSKVTAEQARVLRDLMAIVVDEYGEDPAEAMVAWAEEFMK